MLTFKRIDSQANLPPSLTEAVLVDFLHTHLGQYSDPKEEIAEAIAYAFSTDMGRGGFLLAAYEGAQLVGTLVMNRTGMGRYVPGYLLVYIAVDATCRNQGYGKAIVEEALQICGGDVALHVEYDNPAVGLYERLGFQSKYAEMRFQRDR